MLAEGEGRRNFRKKGSDGAIVKPEVQDCVIADICYLKCSIKHELMFSKSPGHESD